MGETIFGALAMYFWMRGKAVKTETVPALPEPTLVEKPEPEIQDITEHRTLPGFVPEEHRTHAPGYLRGLTETPVWSGTSIPRVSAQQKEWIRQVDP